jgi:tetraacyldisaccharide 4'-kinase
LKVLLSELYGRATTLRRAWYARRPHRIRQLDQPVISVGNLVVGGSGKTPVVAAIAKRLAVAGERPAILSRGYGRREAADGVVVVSDGQQVLATAAQSGDEPFMLARALPGVPVLVSPDRFLAGRLAERRFACTIHLLDDGFQHVQLGRDVNLLVTAPADLEERLLPFGGLREPLSAASAADALLVAGGEADVEVMAGRLGVETAFRLAPQYGAPRMLATPGAVLPESHDRKAVAFAGIARPERFFSALRGHGWNVTREIVFRDHHWFTERDLDAIRRAAADTGAGVVITTEKDAARLDTNAVSGQPPIWAFLPFEVVIEPADRFGTWLAGRLAAARRRRMGAAA